MSQTFDVPIGILEIGRWIHEILPKHPITGDKQPGFVGMVRRLRADNRSIVVVVAPDGLMRDFPHDTVVVSMTPGNPIVAEAKRKARLSAPHGGDAVPTRLR